MDLFEAQPTVRRTDGARDAAPARPAARRRARRARTAGGSGTRSGSSRSQKTRCRLFWSSAVDTVVSPASSSSRKPSEVATRAGQRGRRRQVGTRIGRWMTKPGSSSSRVRSAGRPARAPPRRSGSRRYDRSLIGSRCRPPASAGTRAAAPGRRGNWARGMLSASRMPCLRRRTCSDHASGPDRPPIRPPHRGRT